MYVTTDGVHIVSMSTSRALENAQVRAERLPPGAARESLEAERDAWQRELDEATIAQWERAHGLHMQHRRLAAKHNETLLELAPAYQAAVRREQRRWDLGHVLPAPCANGHEETL
jgi:hypothetical protein